MILVITSCSASKDDSIPIPNGSRVVQPSYYLDDKELILHLFRIREGIFQDPRAHVGTRTTYALDLYVKAGNAYRDLRKNNYQRFKYELISGNVEWFFLSGGYGIIHGLETAKKYQATFNRGIAYQNEIPFTANLWKAILPSLCDVIFSKFDPEWVYVFGNRDYTNFIKQTNFWRTNNNIKMIESTGSSGPSWLSPKLSQLVDSILDENLDIFNEEYARFVKQQLH